MNATQLLTCGTPLPCVLKRACRLPLLEAHCAVWPHTIVAAVYAPVSAARRLVCLSEAGGSEQLAAGRSWLSWLGRGGGDCPYAGWSMERLKRRVRDVQRRAQKTGALACGHAG